MLLLKYMPGKLSGKLSGKMIVGRLYQPCCISFHTVTRNWVVHNIFFIGSIFFLKRTKTLNNLYFLGNKWNFQKFFSYKDMLAKIKEKYPNIERAGDCLNDTSKVQNILSYCVMIIIIIKVCARSTFYTLFLSWIEVFQ